MLNRSNQDEMSCCEKYTAGAGIGGLLGAIGTGSFLSAAAGTTTMGKVLVGGIAAPVIGAGAAIGAGIGILIVAGVTYAYSSCHNDDKEHIASTPKSSGHAQNKHGFFNHESKAVEPDAPSIRRRKAVGNCQ